MQNYYQLFSLPDFAPVEDIQKSFNRLYADLFASESPLANIPRLKELKKAFDILSDPEKREDYDTRLMEFIEELEALFAKAVEAFAKGDYEEAAGIIKDCIRLDPREPDFYETLGLAYQMAEKYREAISSFQQGLQTNTRNPSFHRYLGDVYRKLVDEERAETHYLEAADGFKKILEADPKNLDALENLADTYSRMKWFDEALDIYTQLVALYPYNSGFQRSMGSVLYELDMLEEAEQHLLEALRAAPTDHSSFLFLGLVYFKRRLLALAIRTIEESLAIFPTQPEVESLIVQIKQVQAEVGRTVEEIIYDAAPDAFVEGRVKWFNSETGIGVLTCEEYPEVLLHFSALAPEEAERISKGVALKFGVVKDAVGPIAVDIEFIDDNSDLETLPGVIERFDARHKVGVIRAASDREVSFNFSDLSAEVANKLSSGLNVLFELKSSVGLSDEPIETAVNIRLRKKKA